MQKFTIPDGWTLEQLEEYGRQKTNERRRADYARHPERNIQQRIRTAKNLLRKSGYLVILDPGPGPWDEITGRCILQGVLAAQKEAAQ